MIEPEKWPSSEILNGVFKVKAKVDVEDFQRLLDFADIQTIGNCKSLIQLSSMPVKCLYCKEYGHLRKHCAKGSKKCFKCSKHGHIASECTMDLATAEVQPYLDEDLNEDPIEMEADNYYSARQENIKSLDWFSNQEEPLQVDDLIKINSEKLVENHSSTEVNVNNNGKDPNSLIGNPDQSIEIKKSL